MKIAITMFVIMLGMAGLWIVIPWVSFVWPSWLSPFAYWSWCIRKQKDITERRKKIDERMDLCIHNEH